MDDQRKTTFLTATDVLRVAITCALVFVGVHFAIDGLEWIRNPQMEPPLSALVAGVIFGSAAILLTVRLFNRQSSRLHAKCSTTTRKTWLTHGRLLDQNEPYST